MADDQFNPSTIDTKIPIPDSNSNQKYLLGTLFLLITTILWGSTFTITNQLTQIIPPMFYMGVRYLIGFLAFLPFFKHFKSMNAKTWKITLIASFLLWTSFMLQTIGIKLTTAAKSAFITGLNVIMIPIFAAIIYRQKVRPVIWLSTILALFGISLMSFAGFDQIALGDILVLICDVFYALYVLYLERVLPKVNIIAFSAFQLLSLSLASFFVSLIFENVTDSIFSQLDQVFSLHNLILLLYMGLIATSFATIIQMHGQHRVPATRAALIYALEPIFGALFAVILGNEILGWQTLVGGVLIVGGIFLSIERSSTKRDENKQNKQNNQKKQVKSEK
ncbi:MAG: DMT family transporter [Promethearchaeota archaeon]